MGHVGELRFTPSALSVQGFGGGLIGRPERVIRGTQQENRDASPTPPGPPRTGGSSL
jgi:hypothetical protein